MWDSKIGSRMKEAARRSGMSDAEVARRLEMSPERYGNYARDAREPDFETLLKISTVLGVTPDWLFGIYNEEKPPPQSLVGALDVSLLRSAIIGTHSALQDAEVILPPEDIARIVLAAYRTYATPGRAPSSLPDALAALVMSAHSLT